MPLIVSIGFFEVFFTFLVIFSTALLIYKRRRRKEK